MRGIEGLMGIRRKRVMEIKTMKSYSGIQTEIRN